MLSPNVVLCAYVWLEVAVTAIADCIYTLISYMALINDIICHLSAYIVLKQLLLRCIIQ